MNSQSSVASSFAGNDNKALLWSVLHGGGKFVGIPDSQVPTIKEIFEQTIHSMSEHCRRLNQPVNLNAINKEAVVIICNKIEAIKMQQSPQSQQRQPYQNNPQQIYQKKQQQVPQLETIYRAEDMQKERQNAFQNEFKRKEEEMSSILKLKKPEEINFTDDIYDKPIGNDMERLLAEALASRERELEQIKNVTFYTPETDSQSDSSSKDKENFITSKTTNGGEKRVSFGKELHIINSENNENEMGENKYYNENNVNTDENDGDVNFIFNKLKKIKTTTIKKEVYDNENIVSDINTSTVDAHHADTILQISEDIKYIKTTLIELMEKLNKI
jgi:hypothetical protein